MAVLLLMLAAAFAPQSGGSANLLTNGEFEQRDAGGMAAAWQAYVPAGSARIGVAEASGGPVLVIETASDMKAIAVSSPVPVAPGETLRLSVRCRGEGLSTHSGGTIGFSAGFLDEDRTYFAWQRARPTLAAQGKWFDLQMEAVVPPQAAYVTFQIGLAMMTGKTCWDAAQMTTDAPLAVRFGRLAQTYELGVQPLPVILLNRDPRLAGTSILLRSQPGGHVFEHAVSAAAVEPLQATFSLARRGRIPVTAAVEPVEKTIPPFTASAKVELPPLLVSEPLLPTHWCLEDGAATIEGRVWVHEEASKRSRLRLSCELLNGRSQVLATWTAAPLPPNPALFAMSPRGVVGGDYTVRIRLMEGSALRAELEEPWHVIRRADARVVLGDDGYLRVGGKPLFPIGMFNGGRFPEQAAAGFNVTHHYWTMHTLPGRVAPNRNYLQFLDRTAAAGMKALVLVTHGGPKDRHLGEEVVRSVRMFRNHPALLAWDEEEGVARGEVSPQFVRELREMLRSVDPHHPLILGDTRKPIHLADRRDLFPDESMDLGMWWWYPFPLSESAQDDALAGTQAARSMELVPPEFLVAGRTQKPLWVGVQAYGKPDRRDGRFPTPAEYRLQAYLAIIHGAKGLMYYVGSGSGGSGILNQPEVGHWTELRGLVSELRELEAVLLSPDAAEPVTAVAEPSTVSVRLKAGIGSGPVLLAANRGPSDADAVFRSRCLRDDLVRVRNEPRTIQAQDGSFADRLPPYSVRVYEFGTAEL